MRLPGVLAVALLEHAQREHPRECCGLLAGEAGGQVQLVLPCENIAPAAATFEIGTGELLGAAELLERAGGLELLGVYHSHPHTAPVPSSADRAYAVWWPELVWLIVGLEAGRRVMRAWRFEAGSQFPVELTVGERVT